MINFYVSYSLRCLIFPRKYSWKNISKFQYVNIYTKQLVISHLNVDYRLFSIICYIVISTSDPYNRDALERVISLKTDLLEDVADGFVWWLSSV